MVEKNYIIKSNRLKLREWHEKDIRPFYEMNSDPKVMNYFPNTLTEEESLALFHRLKSHHEEHGFCFFATEEIATNKFIGFVGLAKTKFESFFTPCIEIGWRLDHSVWNKGYASEAALACLNYAFTQLKESEIYSFTSLNNIPSQRVMEKIGMKKLDYFNHPNIEITSELCKHVLYKIEKQEV